MEVEEQCTVAAIAVGEVECGVDVVVEAYAVENQGQLVLGADDAALVLAMWVDGEYQRHGAVAGLDLVCLADLFGGGVGHCGGPGRGVLCGGEVEVEGVVGIAAADVVADGVVVDDVLTHGDVDDAVAAIHRGKGVVVEPGAVVYNHGVGRVGRVGERGGVVAEDKFLVAVEHIVDGQAECDVAVAAVDGGVGVVVFAASGTLIEVMSAPDPAIYVTELRGADGTRVSVVVLGQDGDWQLIVVVALVRVADVAVDCLVCDVIEIQFCTVVAIALSVVCVLPSAACGVVHCQIESVGRGAKRSVAFQSRSLVGPDQSNSFCDGIGALPAGDAYDKPHSICSGSGVDGFCIVVGGGLPVAEIPEGCLAVFVGP